MEWKGIKIIILEYFSLPMFGSFNGENRKLILLFGSLSGREWNRYERTHIPLYYLIPLKLGGMGWNKIRFNEFFTKTLKIPLYIQLFVLK